MDYLRLNIVTYNVATLGPEEELSELLNLGQDQKSLADFYLIGLQEVKSQPQNYIIDAIFDDPWTNAFRKVLTSYGYIKVKTVRLVGLVLSMFCLRKHMIHIRDLKSVCTRTGLLGFWGNKGGMSIRLQIYGCSICFVNCHLTPHDHLLRERIDDYNNILGQQKFETSEATRIMFHDYVFWFGDLNFRIDDITLNAQEINKIIQKGNIADLLEKDQLKRAMASGEAFSELIEPDLTFPPTYKFIFKSNSYDLKRRPAWTDRVLYKVNSNVYENITLDAHLNFYKSYPNYNTSDHKPVAAEFKIKVFGNYVERIIKFLPIREWFLNEENTAICIMSSDVVPSSWDWIAVFDENFTSLEDYHSYIYFPVGLVEEFKARKETVTQALSQFGNGQLEIKFHEYFLRSPGKYRLVYFSEGTTTSVLGMSPVFQACHRNETEPGPSYADW